MKLPTLYKRTSTGEQQEWTIEYKGDQYWTHFGRTGGTIQKSEPVTCAAKNVGRANETTPEEQAKAEAQALWEKKLKNSGYTKDAESAMAGEVSDSVKGGMWPMLAEKYRDHAKKIAWPCFGQLKLNGHRCIAIIDSKGKATLWSRKRNQIFSVPHIVAALEASVANDTVLDGELYDHAYVQKHGLEAFNHLVKRDTPTEGHEVVKYNIYDAPLLDEDQIHRFAYIGRQLPNNVEEPLVLVETRALNNHDEAMAFLEKAMDDGYEGIMLRNYNGMYKSHPTGRSYDLLKLKGKGNKCDDAEFKVVGVKEGKGKMAGKAVFMCVTDKGVPFDAKMVGPIEKLKQYWDNPALIVGKMVTVEFQGFSNKGKPWFPRVLQLRVDL